MSDQTFFLASSTRAIAGSENAIHLIEQKERVEQAVVAKDAALALDTAKAFLETIFKTILSDRVSNADLTQDLNPLYKCVKNALLLNRNSEANDILGKLTSSVVHNIAELRNKYGAASHGKDGHYQNPIEMPEAEMVAHLVDGVAGFILHKHKANGDPSLAVRIYYQDYPEFNEFWDNQNESYKFKLAEDRVLELLPSKLLFVSDPDAIAYREMLLQFLSSEKDDKEMADDAFEAFTISASDQLASNLGVDGNTEFIDASKKPNKEVVVNISGNIDIKQKMKKAIEATNKILLKPKSAKEFGDKKSLQFAKMIIKKIQHLKVVDWDQRTPIIAKMNNVVRLILRRAGYPINHIEKVANSIILWQINNQ